MDVLQGLALDRWECTLVYGHCTVVAAKAGKTITWGFFASLPVESDYGPRTGTALHVHALLTTTLLY